MFKINRRTDYAVRVMLCLARHESGRRMPTQMVQREMQIPSPFLRRIIADLGRVGLIRTYKGPNGGVELGLPAESVQLRHIWEAIEGPLLISDCVNGEKACPQAPHCPVNQCWNRLQRSVLKELEATSLAELAKETGCLPSENSIPALTEKLFCPTASN